MMDPPDKETLLAAVQEFLLAELKPVVTDPRLSFRILIAAHLLGVVGNELRGGAAQDAAERARLATLLGHEGDTAALNAELAAHLRAGVPPEQLEAVRRHLQETLRERLAINNPAFDTRPEIE